MDKKIKVEKLKAIGLGHNQRQGCEAFYTREDLGGICAIEFNEACAWIVLHDNVLTDND